MSIPGPPGALWGFSLILWAASAAVLGEAVRGFAARWLPLWRSTEPVERSLTDLYVGGGTMYLLAAVQLGAFSAPIVRVVPILGGVVVAYRLLRARRRGAEVDRASRLVSGVLGRWTALAVASALGLFVVELAAAVPAPTGNTLDSSLLTTYVSLLLQHGSIPLSFQPYGASAILYPQGSTVWFAWAQSTFGLPPARTAVLVTPLFLALPPLSGYVLGIRWFGSPKVGAAFAVALAFLGPSTRALAGGSNDFVLATPLVLLLAAQARVWFDAGVPRFRDALAFGLLLGYSGALNVVGTEWLLPGLVVLGAVATPRYGGRIGAWAVRWGTAAGAAVLAGLPSVYVMVHGLSDPGTLAGELSAPGRVPVGITAAQLVGDLDPFLFRPSDVALSPIPLVRAELAILLVLGAGVLLLVEAGTGWNAPWRRFGRWAVAGAIATGAWLSLLYLAGRTGPALRVLPFVSNAQEVAWWLFLLYGLVAAVPLAIAFEGPGPILTPRSNRTPGRSGAGPRGGRRALAPIAFALVVVVPAVVLTPASLGPVLSSTYQDFGNVSAADFALLENASGLFAPGSRVLVAPGSAAQFLPGYATGIVLLYPMSPGWSRVNASYSLVVKELSNGTLDAAGRAALAALSVDFVVVTGNNTVLWPAFWAEPLREAGSPGPPTFPVVWRSGDAWVFNAQDCRPAPVGCP